MLVNLGNRNGVCVCVCVEGVGSTINREFKKQCSKEMLDQGLILSTVTSPWSGFLTIDPPLEHHSIM